MNWPKITANKNPWTHDIVKNTCKPVASRLQDKFRLAYCKAETYHSCFWAFCYIALHLFVFVIQIWHLFWWNIDTFWTLYDVMYSLKIFHKVQFNLQNLTRVVFDWTLEVQLDLNEYFEKICYIKKCLECINVST